MGSRKHHYIPQFYLKRWMNATGRVCEFSRPYTLVVPRMIHPDGTGYESDLYTVKNAPSEQSHFMEDYFFRTVDQLASDASEIILRGQFPHLDHDKKSAWSRFVMSLIHRNPEKVAWIGERAASQFDVGYSSGVKIRHPARNFNENGRLLRVGAAIDLTRFCGIKAHSSAKFECTISSTLSAVPALKRPAAGTSSNWKPMLFGRPIPQPPPRASQSKPNRSTPFQRIIFCICVDSSTRRISIEPCLASTWFVSSFSGVTDVANQPP